MPPSFWVLWPITISPRDPSIIRHLFVCRVPRTGAVRVRHFELRARGYMALLAIFLKGVVGAAWLYRIVSVVCRSPPFPKAPFGIGGNWRYEGAAISISCHTQAVARL